MKILFTGDTQVSISNLDRSRATLDQLLEIIQKERCQYLVHLGDFKHTHNPVDQRVTNFLIEFTTEVCRLCNMLALLGNHDQIHAQGDHKENCLPVIEAAGATIFDQPGYSPLDPNVAIFASPYFRNEATQIKVFQDNCSFAKQTTGIKIHIFHAMLKGSIPVDKGYNPWEVGPDVFDWCIGGDIHNQQLIRAGTYSNIWYCGSPFPMDWSEANDTKGFLLLDTDARKIIPIPSRLPRWFDPTKKNFPKVAPKNWNHAKIKISVPVGKDVAKDLHAASKLYTKQYPGADLHLVPEYQIATIPTNIDTHGTTEHLLQRYLVQVSLPPNITIDEVIEFLKHYLPKNNSVGINKAKFNCCTATNVLAFKDVSIKLDRPGLTLVTGVNRDWQGRSNGASKTGLLCLPVLGLFGETPKGQKNSAWVRRDSNKAILNLWMELLDSKQPLFIQRGQSPSLLRVWVDKKEHTMGKPHATQKYIESLTGLTWEVLTNTLYIGQRELGAVFGTEKERKELFSRLLGLDLYLSAQKTINDKALYSKVLIQDRESEIASLNSTIDEIQRSLLSAQSQLGQVPLYDPLEQLLQRQKTLTKEQEKLNQLMLTKTKHLEDAQTEFEKLRSSGEYQYQIQVIKEQLATPVTVDQQCTVCGSVVSQARLSNYRRVLKIKLGHLEAQFQQHVERLTEKRDAIIPLEHELKTLSITAANQNNELSNLRYRIEQSKEAQQVRDQWQTLVNEVQDRLKEKQSLKQIHEASLEQIRDHQRFLQFCASVVSRDGLPSYLCSVTAPALNAAAIKFSEVFAEGEINLQYYFNNGDIDVSVTNLHGGENVTDQSAGEMRMAALISAFACRSVLVPLGILILDEPGESLDAENARVFAKGLQSIVQEFGTVFLVTHNPHIISELEPDYHLEVIKENGIAHVEERTV